MEEKSERSGEGGVSVTPEAEGEGLADTPSRAEAGDGLAPSSDVDAPEASVAQNGVTEHIETEMEEEKDNNEEIPEGNDDDGDDVGLVRLLRVVALNTRACSHTHNHTHTQRVACSQRFEPLNSGAV